MFSAIRSRSAALTCSRQPSQVLIESLNTAMAPGFPRTSESTRNDRPPSTYRMPVRPSTLTAKPPLLSIKFGSGSEHQSSMHSPSQKAEDYNWRILNADQCWQLGGRPDTLRVRSGKDHRTDIRRYSRGTYLTCRDS